MEESNKYWRLEAADTTIHEFFHHVQNEAGILLVSHWLVRPVSTSSSTPGASSCRPCA